MKKFTCLFVILFSACIASAQLNLHTNAFENNVITSTPNKPANRLDGANNNSFGCGDSSFWAIADQGYIEEFLLINDSVIDAGTILTNTNYFDLAFCNNLNDTAPSPTFYSSDGYGFHYYDGTTWQTVNGNGGSNPGGYGNYLYFESSFYPDPAVITRYTGSATNTVYNDSSKTFSVADLAVDDSGNVYACLQSPSAKFDSSSSIAVISPKGVVLKSYHFNFNTYNAYGCFLLNDVYYIGLGPSSHTHPNTLIPVSFVGDSAIVGAPIQMPNVSYGDLASCHPNAAKIFTGTGNALNDFSFLVYPNPADGKITFTLPSSGTWSVSLINMLGEAVRHNVMNANTRADMDVRGIQNGIYFLRIQSGSTQHLQKVVIQH